MFFEIAERKWVERRLNDNTLLVHPNVRSELIERQYKPLARHKKMASIC